MARQLTGEPGTVLLAAHAASLRPVDLVGDAVDVDLTTVGDTGTE